jgi:hypothetical protein
MQIDKKTFHDNIIVLQNSKVLIYPEKAEMTNDKNVIIGDKRIITTNEKILSREVMLEKTIDEKDEIASRPTCGFRMSDDKQL